MPINFEIKNAGRPPGDPENFAWGQLAHAIGLPLGQELKEQDYPVAAGQRELRVRFVCVCAGATEDQVRSHLTQTPSGDHRFDFAVVALLSADDAARLAAQTVGKAADAFLIDGSRVLHMPDPKPGETFLLDDVVPINSVKIYHAGPTLLSAKTIRGRRAKLTARSDGIGLNDIPGDVDLCLLLPPDASSSDLDDSALKKISSRVSVRAARKIEKTLVEALRPFCVSLEETGGETNVQSGARPEPVEPLSLEDEKALLSTALADARRHVMPSIPMLIGTVLDGERPAANEEIKQILSHWANIIDEGVEVRTIINGALMARNEPYEPGITIISDQFTESEASTARHGLMAFIDRMEVRRLSFAKGGTTHAVNKLQYEIKLWANRSYCRLAKLIEIYLQRFVATKVVTKVGDALPQVATNELFTGRELSWALATTGAINEIAERSEVTVSNSLTSVSEEMKGEWNFKMLLQPSWRLGSRVAGAVLAFAAAVGLIGGIKGQVVSTPAIALFVLTAILAICVYALQGRPNVDDVRSASYAKLQSRIEKAVSDIQHNIHAEMSGLLLSRVPAWENEFRIRLLQEIDTAMTHARPGASRWDDRIEAVERELTRLNLEKSGSSADRTGSQAKHEENKLRVQLRRRETWRGTILERRPA